MIPAKQKARELINTAKLVCKTSEVKEKVLKDLNQIRVLAPIYQRGYWENVESEIKKLC